jgi:hypothetical protein
MLKRDSLTSLMNLKFLNFMTISKKGTRMKTFSHKKYLIIAKVRELKK